MADDDSHYDQKRFSQHRRSLCFCWMFTTKRGLWARLLAKSAFTQACAVCSPEPGSMIVMAILRQLSHSVRLADDPTMIEIRYDSSPTRSSLIHQQSCWDKTEVDVQSTVLG